MNKQIIIPTIGLLFSLALPLTATAQEKPHFQDINFSAADDSASCYARLYETSDSNSFVGCDREFGGYMKQHPKVKLTNCKQ